MDVNWYIVGGIAAVIIFILLMFEKTREPTLTILLSPISCLGCLGCGGCLVVVIVIILAIIFGPAVVAFVVPILTTVITFVGNMIGRSIVREEMMRMLEEFFAEFT